MKKMVVAAKQTKVLTGDEVDRLFGSHTGDIVIPDGYTEIEEYAFARIDKSYNDVTSITIPNSVQKIGEGICYRCKGLTSVIIPGSVKSIGKYAFGDCTGLKTAIIEDGVKSIGTEAFEGCESLTSVTIPGSITKIGNYAFSSCSKLTNVNYEGNLESIEFGKDVFRFTPVDYDMQRAISNHASKSNSWEDIKLDLEDDFDRGINDPMYEQTSAGSYIESLCQDVESELGVWLEPSIQGGRGGIWIYSSDDDHTVAGGIDYSSFNENTIDIALESDSEEEFKSAYSAFLETTIEQHSYEEDY